MINSLFPNIIGQKSVIRALEFYLEAQRKTQIMPFLLFTGAKGTGKTELMRQTARNILNPDGSRRVIPEINCSSVKNNKAFFDIIQAYVMPNVEGGINLIFDECHNLPLDAMNALLTICNVSNEPIREYKFEGFNYVFDTRKISFLFATSEAEKVFAPLKDRLTNIELEPYTDSELAEILRLHVGGDKDFGSDLLHEIVSTLRGNARACVKRAEEIKLSLATSETPHVFTKENWKNLKHRLGIHEQGISNSELIVLRELYKRRSCSLQTLVAATGLSSQCLRKSVENNLLKNGWMEILGHRKITPLGHQLVEKIDGLKPSLVPPSI